MKGEVRGAGCDVRGAVLRALVLSSAFLVLSSAGVSAQGRISNAKTETRSAIAERTPSFSSRVATSLGFAVADFTGDFLCAEAGALLLAERLADCRCAHITSSSSSSTCSST